MAGSIVELILASASPRRREILDQLGVTYRVLVPGIDEVRGDGESGTDFALRMAGDKAAAVRAQASDRTAVLAADTVVMLGGVVFGKPRDDGHAREVLRRLSGMRHEVATAVVLLAPNRPRGEVVAVTEVEFRPLRNDQIDRYVATGEGRDKAGSYAIQGLGAGLVREIRGSYSNVVGLPACETVELLEKAELIRWPRSF